MPKANYYERMSISSEFGATPPNCLNKTKNQLIIRMDAESKMFECGHLGEFICRYKT